MSIAQRIANKEYPIDGRSSERANAFLKNRIQKEINPVVSAINHLFQEYPYDLAGMVTEEQYEVLKTFNQENQ